MREEVVYLSDDRVATLTAHLFEVPSENARDWTPQKRPAILIIPGGGYSYCSVREGAPVSLTFNKAGYQAFVLRYHCGNASAYPTPLVESAQACAYIRNHSEEYRLDADKIAVLGFSAGGHLAALLGSSWHRRSLEELTGLQVREMKPNAVLLGYPLVNLQPYIERLIAGDQNIPPVGAMLAAYAPHSDPLALVSALTPPTFLFHTLGDKVILPAETIEYVQTLMKNDVVCEYHEFSEGEHGLSTADSLTCYGRVYPTRVHHWVPLAIAWLNELFQYDF
jgi:acetyl esterase/lipase